MMSFLDPLTPLNLIVSVFCIVLFFCIQSFRSAHSPLPLPPGPRGLPLIGNLFDFPSRDYGEQLALLRRKHGIFLYFFTRPLRHLYSEIDDTPIDRGPYIFSYNGTHRNSNRFRSHRKRPFGKTCIKLVRTTYDTSSSLVSLVLTWRVLSFLIQYIYRYPQDGS